MIYGHTFGLNKVFIECSKKMCDKIYEIASPNNNVVVGTICSSDKFISSEEEKIFLKNKFKAIAVDMETASIAHTAELNNIEFSAIRMVSDNSSAKEYKEFEKSAVRKIADIVVKYLKNI